MKKIVNLILVMVVSLFAFGLEASAAAAPVYDSVNDIFYANGTPITIGTRTGEEGALITWGASGSQEVNPETVIFGGEKEVSYPTSSITMNNGVVYDIFGGGQGSTTVAANVDTAIINFKGGVALSTNGGGYLKSTVKNAIINVTGGVVGNVQGGGYGVGMDYITSASDTVGTEAHPELSTNVVEKATINVTAGRIYDGDAEFGLLFGGGYGFQYVKEVEINIGGTFGQASDYTYVILGGANGRTDKASLNITGGTMEVVQTVNRGSIGNAYIKMTNGRVNNMYVGGETSDKSVNGVISSKVYLALNGGEITSLTAGTSGGTLIPANSPLMEVRIPSGATIGNKANFATLFGTSLKELMLVPKDKPIMFDETEVEEIPADKFEAAKELDVVYIYGTDNFVWQFDGEDITDPTIAVNPEITLTDTAPDDVKEELNKLIPADAKVKFINFAHDGKLPGKATVFFYLTGSDYKVGDELYIAHFNETTKKLENSIKVVVQKEDTDLLFIEFDITECSTYTVSTASLVKNPNTGDNIITYSVLGLISLAGLGIILNKKKLING